MAVNTVLLIILLAVVIIAAILAIELKDLIFAVISLTVLSIALAVVFWILLAPWVALFQLTVYGGAVTVLLFTTVALTERTEGSETDESTEGGEELATQSNDESTKTEEES